ncbi:hypothetical protein LCGC14_0162490 [marine sediment metagenome]|uniref:Type II secretion system protein GspG C-terminal domain-containing protein n=1 Tax=marine sediment metagenome TaxID=412755 RepID=A0A0F9XXA1_9ZZZZ|nr:prepilin-type N-terminal cleavage/methylation domain-containing protein [Phycisphaerae bacterium]HDZ43839.1 prepilin-type N-terminal cleavage/methylation domain-containing protein [Phycisphaerae bacterium]
MHSRKKHKSHGFSMLELVIVIVILGIIAAIAIPRMSRGSEGAAESALKANLAVLRSGIDLFVAEHNGEVPSVVNIENALIQYSDKAGTAFSVTKDTTYYFGPYVRAIPALPVGAKKGEKGIAAADGVGVGWIYDASTGGILSNTDATEKDAAGTPFNQY